jgi:hypothetical protein
MCVWSASIACLALVIAPFVVVARSPRAVGSRLLHAAMMLVTAGGCLSAAWLAGVPLATAAKMVVVQVDGGNDLANGTNILADALNSDTGRAVAVAGASLLAVFAAAVYFAASRRRRDIPASIRILNGLRSAALPVAGVLLLIYPALVAGAVRADGELRKDAEYMVSGEAAHMSATTGMPLPGRVPER